MQQSKLKPVSSGFKQKALRSNKLYIGFNFKHKYAKMSQRAAEGGKREHFWKRWLRLPRVPAFAVSVDEKFIIKKKRRHPALKVTDDGRGQLGHLQRELVPVLPCFPISNLLILDNSKLTEIFLFSNCFKYILGEISFRFSRNWMRFVFLPNKIELIATIGSIEFDNRTDRKVPVQLCLITEPIEQQSNRLHSIDNARHRTRATVSN